MDKEKFKKLVRLANNNPNEHEANLAARMACRMIAENDFAGLLGPAQTHNNTQRAREPRWYDDPVRYHNPSGAYDYERANQESNRRKQQAYDDFYKKWQYKYNDPFAKSDPFANLKEFKCKACGCNAWTQTKEYERFVLKLCRSCFSIEIPVYYDTSEMRRVCSGCGYSVLTPIYKVIIEGNRRCPKCRRLWEVPA